MPAQSQEHQGQGQGQGQRPLSRSWRIIDIVIATVLAVAGGLLFWIWDGLGGAGYEVLNALTPGLGGLAVGVWLLAGVVGGLVIRKPGAALFVELLAAVVSMILGNQWGVGVIYSGLAQGLGAELVFALLVYRRWGLGTAVGAGMASAAAAFALELVTSGHWARSLAFNLTYLGCVLVSGAVLAGVGGFYLVRGLARTGALDRFAAGREAAAQ